MEKRPIADYRHKSILLANLLAQTYHSVLISRVLVNEVFPPVFLSTDEIKLRVSGEVKRVRGRSIGPRLYTTFAEPTDARLIMPPPGASE